MLLQIESQGLKHKIMLNLIYKNNLNFIKVYGLVTFETPCMNYKYISNCFVIKKPIGLVPVDIKDFLLKCIHKLPFGFSSCSLISKCGRL